MLVQIWLNSVFTRYIEWRLKFFWNFLGSFQWKIWQKAFRWKWGNSGILGLFSKKCKKVKNQRIASPNFPNRIYRLTLFQKLFNFESAIPYKAFKVSWNQMKFKKKAPSDCFKFFLDSEKGNCSNLKLNLEWLKLFIDHNPFVAQNYPFCPNK